jgi:hypothetical protein
MAQDNENEFPLPNKKEGQEKRQAARHLPRFFRTDDNKKFLGGSIDPFIQPGKLSRINSYVGRKDIPNYSFDDNYIDETSAPRQYYQLEPAMVNEDPVTGEVRWYADYIDYINSLRYFGANVSNHSRLNKQEAYAWDPQIDWDKIVNYREYYWLPNGPDPVTIFGELETTESTYTVTAVDQGDNVAYLFTPDGLTANPRLTLYKGIKYRFEINTPGKPFAIKTRVVPGDSWFYDTGVSERNVEQGVVEFEVPYEAPDLLYYMDNNDPETAGMIDIRSVQESAFLDVDSEIVGKKTFTSSTGIKFINGLKIKFSGRVFPEKYAKGFWYVEGVGSAIKLVSQSDLETPAVYGAQLDVPFDDQPFDSLPWDNADNYPLTKDYIVINRSSRDRNTWSRNNRWFHRNVIETTANANKQIANLDQSSRAIRPIIEFEPDIKLFNHGYISKTDIDLVDTVTLDVFSTIEGSSGYIVDGEQLLPGYRVLFTADPDPLVNGRIFEVKQIVAAARNGQRQLTLQEINETEPVEGQVVYITKGSNKGTSYHYENGSWKKAQKKISVNQAPLFDLFDDNQVSYSDQTQYPYNTFTGTRIFGYKIGKGSNDNELGFPLSYRNINNIGDIEFKFDLQRDTWSYLNNDVLQSVDSHSAFLRKLSLENNFVYKNGWVHTDRPTEQNVVRILRVTQPTDEIPIDVFDDSASLTDMKIRVYVNNNKVNEFFIDEYGSKIQNLSLITKNDTAYIKFLTPLKVNDKVVYKIRSIAPKNSKGYYEVPLNWQNNPFNNRVNNFTFGEVVDHLRTIVENVSEFEGTFPGIGNLSNVGPISQYGRKFMQHTGPMSLSSFLMVDRNANLVKSLRWTARKYSEFKKEFLKLAGTFGFDGNPREIVDQILSKYSESKYIEISAFYFSDMAPFGASTVREYTVLDPRLPIFVIDSIYSPLTQNKRTILVYLNEEQLLFPRDYEFDSTDAFVRINRTLSVNDKIVIKDYESTDGCYIPFTPSKLGIYPMYEPSMYLDDTYREPTMVIQGHDGSIIKAYGDYRDDIIIELERRIFNSRRVEYDPTIFNIDDVIGGYYRRNDFTKSEINDILLSEFLRWNSIPDLDFNTNNFWKETESFTYNYNRSNAPNDVESLYGFWRGIYKYFYDTDRPHTHPWEMQGFSIKPIWWNDVYGPAPYTSDNKILWDNIEQGLIADPNNIIVDERYARPGLSDYIPVDEFGKLLSPLDSNLAKGFALVTSKDKFNFGDQAPVETAWRRSSEYPYAIMIVLSVLRSSEFIGKFWDRFTIKRNLAGQIYNTLGGEKVSPNDLPFSDEKLNEQTRMTSGLANFIDEYVSIEKFIDFDYYKELLQGLNVKLSYRLGGFTSKEKIKVLLDSRSPNASGTVFLPTENYKVFYNKSAPVDTVNYSGVIIEKKSGGYSVRGYDTEKNYFEVFPHRTIRTDPQINVGGISESFVLWEVEKFYNRGQVVKVGDSEYYRAKVGHTSINFNEDIDKWQKLAKLPIIGGRDAIRRTKFFTTPIKVPYGTTFTDIQSVVDFLLGYQERLKDWGFEFEDYNKELDLPLNWVTSVKEFMFWTLQNWAAGSVITLSPAATRLRFKSKITASVDSLDEDFYDYSIFKADGQPLIADLTNVYREDNGFEITPSENLRDGIFHVRTNLVYKEHIILFDNISIFNDVIYDVTPGYRQGRLKLVGFKTSNWDGGFTSPGFVFDEARILDWQANTDYNLGDIVRYQNYYFSAINKISGTVDFDFTNWKQLTEEPKPGLIPNFDYKVEQFRDFYSLENSNFDADQQNLSRHLIGYQPRQYLENIIIDDVSSYKFYQGFIKEKGTLNSVNKLFDALRSSGFSSINIKEEWAFKVGDFGASDAYSEIEFALNEEKFLYNPQDIVLTQNKTEFNDLTIYNIPASSVSIKPVSYNSKPFPLASLDHTQNDYGIFKYKVAGYVRDDDVEHVLYNEDALLNYDISLLKEKDKIWLGNTTDGDWEVFEYLNSNVIVTNWEASGNSLRLFCDTVPDLKINQIITLRNLGVLDSTYKVLKLYSNIVEVFTFNSAVFKNNDFSTAGQLFKFESSRYSSAKEVSTKRYNELKIRGEKIWIDEDKNGNWLVLENIDAFTEDEVPALIKDAEQLYGYDVKISENKLFMFVSAPKYNSGSVMVYTRPNNISKWTFLQNLLLPSNLSSDTDTELFGTSIDVSYNGKLLAVSAPALSNLKTYYKGNFNPSASYVPRDVVRYNGKLWENLNAVNGDGSTITVESQDWKEVNYYSFRARPTNYRGVYDPLVDYFPGDTVLYNDVIWRNLVAVIGSEFNVINDNWEVDDSLNQMRSAGTSSGLTNQGAVIIFYYDESVRRFREETILGAFEPENNEKFGNKVKLRFDGSKYWLFVGAKNYNNDYGRVHVFCKDPIEGWKFNDQRYLDFTNILGAFPSPLDPLTVDGQYGYDIDANTSASKVVVSAPYLEAGAVYVFERTDTAFQLIQVVDSYTIQNNITPINQDLKNSDINYFLEDNEIFGYSVFIRNDSLYVSIPNDDNAGYNVGSVYYFDYVGLDSSANPYSLRQVIVPPSSIDNERFGTKIDVTPSGGIIAISSIGGDYVIETKFDNFSDRTSFNEDSTRNYELDENSNELVGTTFDSSSTLFYDRVPYTGAVYVYNRIDDDFIYADKLLPPNNLSSDDNFGFAIDTNDDCIVVGTPNYFVNNQRVGTVFVFNYDQPSWSIKHSQNAVVDVSKFKKSFIYDTKKSYLIDNLDFIDPVKGAIPKLADQEIKFQTYYDPAIYEYGVGSDIRVDQSSPWNDDHVGEIWWDLSKVKWTWYEQGDSTYRNNNWGRIFPGSQVDIYEWVESVYLPSRYAELADTREGLAQGISGIPKDADDFTYSSKLKYDPVARTNVTMYYFWVKNKTTVPRNYFRTIPASDVAKLIADPRSQSYKYVAITSENSLSLVNIKSKLIDSDISINLQFYTVDNIDLLVHREYALIAEDDPQAKIPTIIENKWFDSLIGYNVKGQRVPDTKLSFRQRYGAANEPQQSWFKNRFEALKQFFEYTNSVLAKRQIVDDINFANLLRKDPAPSISSGDIDTTVDILDDLRFIGTAYIQPATLSVTVVEGKIINAGIIDSGYGYGKNKTYAEDELGNPISWYGPKVKVLGTGTGAEIQSIVDTQGKVISLSIVKSGKDYDSNTTTLKVRGFTVLVLSDQEANTGWSLQEWDNIKRRWVRVKTQAFDVKNYWEYKDWYATDYGFGQTDFGIDTDINYLIENAKDLNGLPCPIGGVVKINNAGFGNWLLLVRKAITGSPDFTDDYDVVGKQNATIKFSDKLYNLNKDLGYDSKSTFDLNTYDRYPTTELRIILETIRDNIFVDDLREEYIRLFFNSVQYAMHEHLYIDWAFKTSFVKAHHSVGTLKQKTTFQSDVLDSYQQFLEEAKPYKTKIREFVSSYDVPDTAGIITTDFDLPAYYDTGSGQIERTTIESEVINTYPWKNWLDNYTYQLTDIIIQNGGEEYTSVPKVIISGGGGKEAAATAYIANGKVYKIVIDAVGVGYTSAPLIFISGGNGYGATAVAKIGNGKVRTNYIAMKYDRNSLTYTVNNFKHVDVFFGTGGQRTFKLTYAPEIQKSKFNIVVNNIEYYGSQYDVIVNESFHDSYTALEGYVEFKEAPSSGARIVITYDKNIKLYNAADRINYAYNPTDGMYGKDLGQLMTGIDYGGVQLQSIDFEIGSGWDVLPWDVSSWDNVLTSNDEYIVASDGTTMSFTLPYVPAVGEVINIYINDIRVDDPYFDLYDGSTEQPNGRVTAPIGTVMNSFVGDGIENVIELPSTVDLLPTDILIFRKSTSDGSILPTDRSLIDAFVLGGTLDTTNVNGRQIYNNAAGILADEIIIDGDEFVTTDTSHGPEELVQGQVIDALDIKVYHAPAAGGPNVYIKNYTGDGVTTEFALDQLPSTTGGVFLLINDIITDFTINYTTNTVTPLNGAPLNGAKIAIITIDTAGYDITDRVSFVGDGSTKEFLTAAQFNGGDVSGFVTINGISVDFSIKESDDAYEVSKRTIVVFEEAPEQGDQIQIMMFNGTIQKWSEVTTQMIPIVPGQFTYDLTPVPAVVGPLSAMVFVVVDNEFLQAPDFEYFTYNGVPLTISDVRYTPNTLRPQDIDVYKNGVKLTPIADYVLNSVQNTVTLTTGVAANGDSITIEIVKNSDFRVIENQLILSNTNYSIINKNEIRVTTFTNHDILKVKTSNVGFRFNTGYDVYGYDIIKFDILNSAVNTSGIFDLPRSVSDNSGVFVGLNRLLLTPNVDYVVLDNRRQIKVLLPDNLKGDDYIEIITFNDQTVKPSYGFSIFKDMINRYHYKRLDSNASTALKESLTYLDTRIVVHDSSVLPEPNREGNLPGIIMIDGERIEYFVKDGDTLRQLRRGTLGTGIKDFYPTGTEVIDMGITQTVPYSDEEVRKTFIADGNTQLFELDFFPSVRDNTIDNEEWYRQTIPNEWGQSDELEVFVSGRRLRKNPIVVYDQTLGQDSFNGAGNKQIEAEFSVSQNNSAVRLTETPETGSLVVIVYKKGKIWQKIDEKTSLVFSNTPQAKFLTAKTVNLPK